MRVLEAAAGRLVAVLPTSARVTRIAFTAGHVPYLATLDGTMLRVWDWSADALRARICERWEPGIGDTDGSDAIPVLSRSAFCDAR